MKIYTAMVVLVVLTASLLYLIRRMRPGIPGLPRTPFTAPVEDGWRLWLVFLLSGLLVSAVITMLAGAPRESTLGYLRIALSTYAGEDSWMPMLQASLHLETHPELPVYQTVFFQHHVKFQYPLTALLFIDVPRELFGVHAVSVVTAFKILSRLSLVLIGWVFFKLFMGALREANGGHEVALSRLSTAVLAGFSVLGVVLFYPVIRSEYHGQIQTAMTLAAALALLAWQRRQVRLAGVLVGLCCLIKPQWGVVILWAVFRREWKFAVSASVTGALFLLLAVCMYGFDNVVDYLPVLSFLGKHGESYYINQSVNGLMHRLFNNGVNLDGAGKLWSGTDFPPFHPVVYMATNISSAVLLCLAMFWRMAKRPTAIDLSLVMLSMTMGSPIAWDHHYGVLLPIFAVVFPAALRFKPWGAWTLPFLWIAFTLTGQSFSAATNLLAGTHLNFLQSYLFFGALMVLAMLYRLSWQEERAGSEARAWSGDVLPAKASAS